MSDLQHTYVTVPDVAAALDQEPWAVYELVPDKLPAEKVGRNWLIKRSDAIAFCRARRDELAHKAGQYEMAIGRLAA